MAQPSAFQWIWTETVLACLTCSSTYEFEQRAGQRDTGSSDKRTNPARRQAARPCASVSGIHSDGRHRYTDGMSATNPVTPEPRRFSMWMPRPLWVRLATVVLVAVA